MSEFLNHYSYAIAGLLALVAIGSWAFRRRTPGALAALTLAAVAIAGVDLAFRPGEPDVVAAADLDRVLASGKPALVEFYSNY